jgi:hypothetical protein
VDTVLHGGSSRRGMMHDVGHGSPKSLISMWLQSRCSTRRVGDAHGHVDQQGACRRGGSNAQQDVEWLSEYAGVLRLSEVRARWRPLLPPPVQPVSLDSLLFTSSASYLTQTASCSRRSLLLLFPSLETIAPCTSRLASAPLHSTDRSDLHRVRLNSRQPASCK